MAGQRISELSDIDALSGGDFLPISRGVSTLKIRGDKIFPIKEFRLDNNSVSTRTIINNSVTLPKLEGMPANTVIGRPDVFGNAISTNIKTDMVENNAITYQKIQNLSTGNRVLGSITSNGAVSEVQISSAMVVNEAITYPKIQKISTANRVLGTITSNGVVSEVQVAREMIVDGAINQAKLSNSSVGRDQIIDNNVTVAKFQQIAQESVLGNPTAVINNIAATKVFPTMIGDGFGLIPRGGIILWSGATNNIPSGWVLCNGQNGTPDLRNRFVVGAGSTYGVGDTGGSNTVTLTKSQLPEHNHSGSTNSTGSHTHGLDRVLSWPRGGRTTVTEQNQGGNPEDYNAYTQNTDSAGSHSHTVTTENVGDNQAHENRPPYYALAYIMKL